jgi:HlyD family secretion protein
VVLEVPEESRRVVAPGERLLEIGDPTSLEIRSDILSQDAVRVKPGQRARIEHWGGEEVLRGTVTGVEPAAFTKVSALGVDEQRVWVTIALETTPEAPGSAGGSPLGHGFRVEVRIVTWEAPDVLLVPAGAVFRSGDGWGVFRVGDGHRAERVSFAAGRRNPAAVEVLDGLADGDRVILHPGDRVEPGQRLRVRTNGRP